MCASEMDQVNYFHFYRTIGMVATSISLMSRHFQLQHAMLYIAWDVVVDHLIRYPNFSGAQEQFQLSPS